MNHNTLAKLATTTALGLVLTGCKLAIIVGEGGEVTSLSGNNDCTGPNYCIVEVTSETFTETFTAIAEPGYEFVKWQDGEGFQCAGSTSTSCTVSISGNPYAEAIVASFETASLRPVFLNVGIDTDGDGLRNSIDPDDDNDGVLDDDDLDPLDPNVTTTCGATPGNVTLTEESAVWSWSNPGSQVIITLGQGDIKSTEFNATEGTSYGGQISVASTTGNSGVQRRVWISQCPGGEPLPDPKCESLGTSSTVVPWYQGPSNSSYCNLQPLYKYFINYENINCDSSSCNVYRNLYNNGNP